MRRLLTPSSSILSPSAFRLLQCQQQAASVSSSSSSSVTAELKPKPSSSSSSSSVTPLSVYIESTDAFQVVYYANYFKFLQWGISSNTYQRFQRQQQQQQEASPVTAAAAAGDDAPQEADADTQTTAALTSHSGPPLSSSSATRAVADALSSFHPESIISVTNMKYRKPALLGDRIAVETIPVPQKRNHYQQNIVRVSNCDAQDILISADIVTVCLESTQSGTAASCDTDSSSASASTDSPSKPSAKKKLPRDTHSIPIVHVTPDDVVCRTLASSICGGSSSSTSERLGRSSFTLTIDACLRYMERSRSDWLGGPETLRRFQHPKPESAEKPMTVVVARIDDFHYYGYNTHGGQHSSLSSSPISSSSDGINQQGGVKRSHLHAHASISYVPGATTARVQSEVTLNRTQIAFKQSVFLHHEHEDGNRPPPAQNSDRLIAEATVTCCCVSSSTGRPCPPPAELQRKFFV